jgi:hypothetical protein
MIKIVAYGKEIDVVYQGKCPHCEAIIQCDFEDFEFPDRPCGEGAIKCPIPKCTGAITIGRCKKVSRKEAEGR